MKKYLAVFFFSLALVVSPVAVMAVKDIPEGFPTNTTSGGANNSGVSGTQCENDGGIDNRVASLFPTKFCSATDLIVGIVKILLSLSGAVAVLFIAIGGAKYLSADEKGVGAAKTMITNAVTGLIIIILAYTLVTITLNLFNSAR